MKMATFKSCLVFVVFFIGLTASWPQYKSPFHAFEPVTTTTSHLAYQAAGPEFVNSKESPYLQSLRYQAYHRRDGDLPGSAVEAN
ncbi:hypothetical protein B566_EDAN009973 [Ephemera danica]|nr:hypothetical protein B566_EDAN009973 [Ephemera danica]